MPETLPLTANERTLFRIVISLLVHTRAMNDVLLETNLVENTVRLTAALQRHQAGLQPQLDRLLDPAPLTAEDILQHLEGLTQTIQ